MLPRWKKALTPLIMARSSSKKISRVEEMVDLDLATIPPSKVRNFGIIAHIDHGKSTLADRLLELSKYGMDCKNIGNIPASPSLDTLPVERQRGITVKAQSATMLFRMPGQTDDMFLLNLLDTPGHADFSNEVVRSLTAVQGALLLVDATQGVQAQTIAHYRRARDYGLNAIIPIINKIDLPTADIPRVQRQLEYELRLRLSPLLVSAKTGEGVSAIIPAILEHIPAPQDNSTDLVRIIVVDCWYEEYHGVVSLVHIQSGNLRKGVRLQSANNKERILIVERLGILCPHPVITTSLGAGQVGWIRCGIKDPREVVIGDVLYDATMVSLDNVIVPSIHHHTRLQPVVFASFFPENRDFYDETAIAIDKLLLNDSSVQMEKQNSPALGAGWRLGFLGSLHLDVFSQRLAMEFGVSVIVTAPTVRYRYLLKSAPGNSKSTNRESDEDWQEIHSAEDFPNERQLAKVKMFTEPYVEARIIFPNHLYGSIARLCSEYRAAEPTLMEIPEEGGADGQATLLVVMPLAEVIGDFSDRLLSLSSGYASLDYQVMKEFRPVDLACLTVKLNGEPVDVLSVVHPRERAERAGRALVEKLVKVLPRQQFPVAIQATIGSRVIARETLSALRKDYGGDKTRKMKLLAQQKEGKAKLKSLGHVQVSNDIFASILRQK